MRGKGKLDTAFESSETNYRLTFCNGIVSFTRHNEDKPRKTEKYRIFNEGVKIHISIGIESSEICAINEFYIFLKKGENYSAYLKVN